MASAYLLIKHFNQKLRYDDISAYASSIAFFLFLSLIPLLILSCYLLPYTPLREADLMIFCMNVVPRQMSPWMVGVIRQIYDKPKGIISATLIIAVWSAGKGMLALMRALNKIYEAREERSYFKLRVVASVYTVIILVAFIVTFVLGVFGRNILGWLAQCLPWFEANTGFVSYSSYVFMVFMVILAFTGIYTYIPNRKLVFKKQFTGACFVSIAWSVFTFGFSLYVEYFSSFSTYGTVGTVILFLFWLYFCCYIMLLGAVINCFYDNMRGIVAGQ